MPHNLIAHRVGSHKCPNISSELRQASQPAHEAVAPSLWQYFVQTQKSKLCRCMGGKLQHLWTESLDPNHQYNSTLHLNGIPSLALFLSYLTYKATGVPESGSSAFSPHGAFCFSLFPEPLNLDICHAMAISESMLASDLVISLSVVALCSMQTACQLGFRQEIHVHDHL